MEVILVNERDEPMGTMEKMEAHRKGLLHRAFSVLVFNRKGEMLLQQRALSKYHSGGLWTNACCSHPAPGERITDAIRRRLKEETGLDGDPHMLGQFIYRAELDGGMTEHELDHVFTMTSDDQPVIVTEEAMAYRWVPMKELQERMKEHPELFTVWFRLIMQRFYTPTRDGR